MTKQRQRMTKQRMGEAARASWTRKQVRRLVGSTTTVGHRAQTSTRRNAPRFATMLPCFPLNAQARKTEPKTAARKTTARARRWQQEPAALNTPGLAKR